MSLNNYVYFVSILFVIGVVMVLLCCNVIVVFMGVELMFNVINLFFVMFVRM